MKPNTDHTVTNVGTVTDEVRLGLDPNAVAHLIGVLTDLYSDPIKAVIREYSTNALDSHIEAGVSDPIEVRLPSVLDQTFTVQDHGLGLSYDDLCNVYSLYGASSKRDNDAVNGVLGLGCKSALTYTISFTVTAVKDGVKSLVLITKDFDGVGTIKRLDSAEVDERNSVTISVPVKAHDVEKFCKKARAFYKFWAPGTVLVDGEAPDFLREDPELIWLDEDVAIHTKSTNSFVVQNGVAYPVRESSVPSRNFGTVAWVESGAINFTPSREALQYTPRTEEVVRELRTYVEQRHTQAIIDSLDTINLTPFERLKLAARWRSIAPRVAAQIFGEYGTHPKLPPLRKTWRFDVYANRGAAWACNPAWFDLEDNDRPIIVGYPFKNVTTVVRKRLREFHAGRGISAHYLYLFPEDVDLGALVGRDNILTWDEVAAETEHVVVKHKALRGPKASKVVYTVYHQGCNELVREDELDVTRGPICWSVGGVWFTDKHPEAQIVAIRDGQQQKLQRLYPSAQDVQDYHRTQRDKVAKAITDYDRLIVASRDFFGAVLELKDRAKILDPEFRAVCKAAGAQSRTLADYQRVIGVTNQIDNLSTLPSTVAERYPLVANDRFTLRRSVKDAVLYINAKFATLNLTTN